MNKLTIIGNLTRDPESRTTKDGKTVCSFTMAVNRRGSQREQADYFRVSAFEKLGQNCQQYLAKGRKAAVIGSVSVSTYTGSDGASRASLEVLASDVEFLSPRADAMDPHEDATPEAPDNGFEEVTDDDLPF